jgi:hypothetical protein
MKKQLQHKEDSFRGKVNDSIDELVAWANHLYRPRYLLNEHMCSRRKTLRCVVRQLSLLVDQYGSYGEDDDGLYLALLEYIACLEKQHIDASNEVNSSSMGKCGRQKQQHKVAGEVYALRQAFTRLMRVVDSYTPTKAARHGCLSLDGTPVTFQDDNVPVPLSSIRINKGMS